MTEEDKEAWEGFKANVIKELTEEQYKLLCVFHARYYNHRYHEPCSCNKSELKMWIADIDRIYNS